MLLGSHYYNLFSLRSKEIINKILELNHDIGLHFDPSNYQIDSYQQLLDLINNEFNTINGIYHCKVSFYSFHNPSGNPTYFDQLKWDERYVHSDKFESLKYISDSKMYFREDLIKYIEDSVYKSYQINLHPIWYKENPGNVEKRLRYFVNVWSRRLVGLVKEDTKDYLFGKFEDKSNEL